jgi:hypothetical protein
MGGPAVGGGVFGDRDEGGALGFQPVPGSVRVSQIRGGGPGRGDARPAVRVGGYRVFMADAVVAR